MRLSNEPTYTVLPAGWVANIEKLLNSNDKIEYSILGETDMPEDIPARCMFKGREIIHPILCIRSNLIPEELTKAVEDGITEAIIG